MPNSMFPSLYVPLSSLLGHAFDFSYVMYHAELQKKPTPRQDQLAQRHYKALQQFLTPWQVSSLLNRL